MQNSVPLFRLKLSLSGQPIEVTVRKGETPLDTATRICKEHDLAELEDFQRKLISSLQQLAKKKATSQSLQRKISNYLDSESLESTPIVKLGNVSGQGKKENQPKSKPSKTKGQLQKSMQSSFNLFQNQHRPSTAFDSVGRSLQLRRSSLLRIEQKTLKAFQLCNKVQNSDLRKIILAILSEVQGKNGKEDKVKQAPTHKPITSSKLKEIPNYQFGKESPTKPAKAQAKRVSEPKPLFDQEDSVEIKLTHQLVEPARPASRQGLIQRRQRVESKLSNQKQRIQKVVKGRGQAIQPFNSRLIVDSKQTSRGLTLAERLKKVEDGNLPDKERPKDYYRKQEQVKRRQPIDQYKEEPRRRQEYKVASPAKRKDYGHLKASVQESYRQVEDIRKRRGRVSPPKRASPARYPQVRRDSSLGEWRQKERLGYRRVGSSSGGGFGHHRKYDYLGCLGKY